MRKPIAKAVIAVICAGIWTYPVIFLPLDLILALYFTTLLLWTKYHTWQSKKLGLKVILLLPCENWFFKFLAARKSIQVSDGKIIEMHLNTKVKYPHDCEEANKRFREDIGTDLQTIKKAIKNENLRESPVITLNTFNKYWLKKTEEILGGKRYSGIVLTNASCSLYKPKRHKKIFKKIFPQCCLKQPGRDNPSYWDLIIIEKGDLMNK